MPGFKPALVIPKERNIQHFTLAEWVDFSRGLLNGARFAEMRDHADACRECRDMADYCLKLARVCLDTPANGAPDDVVRRAYAIFPERDDPSRDLPEKAESLVERD